VRKVIANLFASIDGFAADRADGLAWLIDDWGHETAQYVRDHPSRWTSCCSAG
jgi:hypothetical protein